MARSFSLFHPNPPEYDFKDVAQRLLRDGRSVAQMLAPGGRMEGAEYVVRNPTRSDGRPGSFKINTATGAWADFATNAKGGDFVSFWAFVEQLQQHEARDRAVDYLGLGRRVDHAMAQAPQPKPAPKLVDTAPRLVPCPPADEKFDFVTADGLPFIVELRTNKPDGGKTYRQWNARDQSDKMPAGPKPIYNLPALMAADPTLPIVVTEGARKAHVLIEAGYLATACLGGASSVGKADWSPLQGRHVIVWPDNDAVGKEFHDDLTASLQGSAASIRTVPIPPGKPPKWDAYDATPAEREALINGVVLEAPAVIASDVHDPAQWTVDRFTHGDAPERQWLLERAIPLATAGLFVALGDTGKGMLLLDMALKIAAGVPDMPGTSYEHKALGCKIMAHGTAVIVSAEDDAGEIWRRLDGIDPEGLMRARASKRMFVFPLPNMGGVKPFFVATKGEVHTTKHFDEFRTWALAQTDLRMIVIDPLSSFSHVDPNAAEVGGFVTGVLAALAADTGAAVIVAHHMRKSGTGKNDAINSVEAARNAVRGSGALVDGVRWAYVLWPVEPRELKRLKAKAAFNGAVVKSNGPADRTVRTFVRNEQNGLLVDTIVTAEARNEMDAEIKGPLLDALFLDLAWQSHRGWPIYRTGKNGIAAQKHLLQPDLRKLKGVDLTALVDDLLEAGRLVQSGAKGDGPLVVEGDESYRAGDAAKVGQHRKARDSAWAFTVPMVMS